MISNLEIDNLTNYQNYFKNFKVYLLNNGSSTYTYFIDGVFTGNNISVNIPINISSFTIVNNSATLILASATNSYTISNLTSITTSIVQYYPFYIIYDIMQNNLYFNNTKPSYLPHQIITKINFVSQDSTFIPNGLYTDNDLQTIIAINAPMIKSVIDIVAPLSFISSATNFSNMYENYIEFIKTCSMPVYNIELYNFVANLKQTIRNNFIDFINAQYNFVQGINPSNTNLTVVNQILNGFASLKSQTTFVGFVNGLMSTLISFSSLPLNMPSFV